MLLILLIALYINLTSRLLFIGYLAKLIRTMPELLSIDLIFKRRILHVFRIVRLSLKVEIHSFRLIIILA